MLQDENKVTTSLSINQVVQKDIEFIKNEIIAKNVDGTYTKFCRALDAVSVIGVTQDEYRNYWIKQYNKEPLRKKGLGIILATIDKKFESGLTDTETMLKLIENSNDTTKDKPVAISLLTGGVK